MNITITTFTNPFSFFCLAKDNSKDNIIMDCKNSETKCDFRTSRIDLTSVNHGQYVAVMWRDKWVRGVVTMESRFLIWLVDYGIYLRPDENTVYTNLPSEYKKYPTKVFEASIHGVMPVDKTLTEDCQIENKIGISWNKGAIEKVHKLIANASATYFVPVGLLSTKENDVVIGDLYFELKNQETIVNVVEELEMWPVSVQRNKEVYMKNLSVLYTNRRRHRACLLKPVCPDTKLKIITLQTTLEEYEEICDSVTDLRHAWECKSDSLDGSTVLDANGQYKKDEKAHKLTADEIEKYAHMYITVGDRDYNVLNVLLNKIRDLNMCEKYKNLKSVGRATSRLRSKY